MPEPRLSRDASGQLFFDLFHVSAADYPDVCEALAAEFALSSLPESFGADLDAVAMDYRQGDQVIELAWDNWSGFIVTAKSINSDLLVREIVAWLLCSKWFEGRPA